MPTTKPRVIVSLSQPHFNLLRNLAALQGVSMSAVMADLFETAAPAFERVAVLLQQAKDAPVAVRAKLMASLDRASAFLDPQAAGLLAQSDFFLRDVASVVEAGNKAVPGAVRAKRGTKPAPRPPSSNRGVRSRPKTAKSRSKRGG